MLSILRRTKLFACGALLVLAACSESDPVRQYTIPKQREEAAAPEKSFNLAWFFKVTGPQAAIDTLVAPFGKFIGSVRFASDGSPTWKLPEGWTEHREQGIRFATIKVPSDPPLELSVIVLPHEDPTSSSYLRENFNRWRGQLQLAPREGDDWMASALSNGELAKVNANGRTAIVVNLTGTQTDQTVRMLAAIIPSTSAAAPVSNESQPRSPAVAGTQEPFPSTLPAGWQKRPAGQFQLAAFTAGPEDQPVSISVSTAKGSVLDNVNRWRKQVGLPDDPQAASAGTSLTIDDAPGTQFFLEGAEQSILGVIVPRENTTWFFKAVGPTASVALVRPQFEEFLQSFRFPN